MTREEAFKKAVALSRTFEVGVSESENYYTTDKGEKGHYVSYDVMVDGVRSIGMHKSYEAAFKDLEPRLELERRKKVEKLRQELEQAEKALEK